MSYDRRPPTRYIIPQVNFAAGASRYIRGPLGKGGVLVDYGVFDVTTAFTATTTAGTMSVGKAGTPAAYGAALSMGTTAPADGGKSVLSSSRPNDAAYNALMTLRSIPPDTPILLTAVAPTGGTPAGVASMFVDVIWED